MFSRLKLIILLDRFLTYIHVEFMMKHEENIMKKLCLLALFLLITFSILGQYVPVEIVNNAEDMNGRMLVTKFRDLIRNSPAYTVGYDSGEMHFKILISTMDRYKGDYEMEGMSTIYNYTIIINVGEIDMYCYSQLGYAGKNLLDSVAYQIYSDMDEFIEAFKASLMYYMDD